MAEEAPFQPYPVTGDAIRDSVEQARAERTSLNTVIDGVLDLGRGAVSDTAGDISRAFGSTTDRLSAVVGDLGLAAEIVEGAIEMFASAVDAYNETSVDPMSIARLNDEASSGSTFEPRELLEHWRRLRRNLDDAAEDVERIVLSGPSESDIRLMFLAGAISASTVIGLEDVTLTYHDWSTHVIQQIRSGELLDLAAIPPDVLAGLRTDPSVLRAANVQLLGDVTLGEQDAGIVHPDGQAGSRQIYDMYYRLFWATASAEYVQIHGGVPALRPNSGQAYLETFYATSLSDHPESLAEDLRQLDQRARAIVGVRRDLEASEMFSDGLAVLRQT